MSMNDDCMPGRTFETRPLYTLPTTPRCRSRSTKTSATRSSSRMATIVSWPLEETIISLFIHELLCVRSAESLALRVDHLKGEAGEHAKHEVRAEAILGQAGRLERAQNHEQIQTERHQDAGETLFLGQHRENEIVVGDREEPQLTLRPLPEPLPGKSSRPHGDARLDLLVAGAFRILRWIEESRDSRFLVILQRELPR